MYIIINTHYSSSISDNIHNKKRREDLLKQIHQRAVDALKNQRFRF